MRKFPRMPHDSLIQMLDINWQQFELLYAFPPFSVVSKCLQKLDTSNTTGVFVLPLWPTQPWFTRALQMLIAQPLLLPQISSTEQQSPSPSCQEIETDSVKVIEQSLRARGLSSGPLPSSSSRGETEAKSSTSAIINDGYSFVVKGKLIQLKLL